MGPCERVHHVLQGPFSDVYRQWNCAGFVIINGNTRLFLPHVLYTFIVAWYDAAETFGTWYRVKSGSSSFLPESAGKRTGSLNLLPCHLLLCYPLYKMISGLIRLPPFACGLLQHPPFHGACPSEPLHKDRCTTLILYLWHTLHNTYRWLGSQATLLPQTTVDDFQATVRAF